jgi:hypothetical protein
MKKIMMALSLLLSFSTLACTGKTSDGKFWISVGEVGEELEFKMNKMPEDKEVIHFKTKDYTISDGGRTKVSIVTFYDKDSNPYSYENTSDIHGGKYDKLVVKGKEYKVECDFIVID